MFSLEIQNRINSDKRFLWAIFKNSLVGGVCTLIGSGMILAQLKQRDVNGIILFSMAITIAGLTTIYKPFARKRLKIATNYLEICSIFGKTQEVIYFSTIRNCVETDNDSEGHSWKTLTIYTEKGEHFILSFWLFRRNYTCFRAVLTGENDFL
jgi:hypothetical protein